LVADLDEAGVLGVVDEVPVVVAAGTIGAAIANSAMD
jgi:hypothetical protein